MQNGSLSHAEVSQEVSSSHELFGENSPYLLDIYSILDSLCNIEMIQTFLQSFNVVKKWPDFVNLFDIVINVIVTEFRL